MAVAIKTEFFSGLRLVAQGFFGDALGSDCHRLASEPSEESAITLLLPLLGVGASAAFCVCSAGGARLAFGGGPLFPGKNGIKSDRSYPK